MTELFNSKMAAQRPKLDSSSYPARKRDVQGAMTVTKEHPKARRLVELRLMPYASWDFASGTKQLRMAHPDSASVEDESEQNRRPAADHAHKSEIESKTRASLQF